MKNDFKTSFTIHFVYILHNCDIYQQLSWVYLSVAGMLIMLHIYDHIVYENWEMF